MGASSAADEVETPATAGPLTTTIGVLGGRWRGDVDDRGRVVPWDGQALDWWVAAEDRWHDPRTESAVRHRRIDGAPVLETRVRVPGGDVVQRVYAVADEGGLTMVEVENESSASVAVVFSHGRLLTPRPPAAVPIEGIEVPSGAVSFPVGHHSTLRVALSHSGAVGLLPPNLPSATSVARGWTRRSDAASRVVLPDASLADRLVHWRCSLVLDGLADPKQDAAGFLVGLGELVRMGADAVDLVPDAVTAAERLAKSARSCGLDWSGATALRSVQRLLIAADDRRAAADVGAMRKRLGGDGAPAPLKSMHSVMYIPWLEQRLARPDDNGHCVLLAHGHPKFWMGANWEVHHLPAGNESWVGYAVRWHGDRPAVLWEVTGEPVVLEGGVDAQGWSTAEPSGEVLWPSVATPPA